VGSEKWQLYHVVCYFECGNKMVKIYEFGPGEIDVGEVVDVCYESREECNHVVNGPENNPEPISN
jgi:hypothetical protein